MRKLIRSLLGTTAALALTLAGAACTRSPSASSSPSVQTPSPAAERVNPGAGYFGNASDNVNRPSTAPTGVGGGPTPADDPWAGDTPMGIEQGGSGTSGSGSTGAGTDMTGGDAGPKTEKGSGSTGGMSK